MSLGLDLSGVTETGGPVPTGTYAVVLDKAEVSPTKTGGEMIKVQYRILDGQPQSNRVVFDQFNIKNNSAQAVQIGLGQLKGMLKAFGHPNPNKLESCNELLGLKGQISVKVESDPGYPEQARVKSYKPLMNAVAAPGAPVAPVAAGENPF